MAPPRARYGQPGSVWDSGAQNSSWAPRARESWSQPQGWQEQRAFEPSPFDTVPAYDSYGPPVGDYLSGGMVKRAADPYDAFYGRATSGYGARPPVYEAPRPLAFATNGYGRPFNAGAGRIPLANKPQFKKMVGKSGQPLRKAQPIANNNNKMLKKPGALTQTKVTPLKKTQPGKPGQKEETDEKPLVLNMNQDVDKFLEQTKGMTESRRRQIRFKVLRFFTLNGIRFHTIMEQNGIYNKRGELHMKLRLRNYYPDYFEITAKGYDPEAVAYDCFVQLFLKFHTLGILPKEVIMNLFQKKNNYHHDLFVKGKICVGVMCEETSKESIAEEVLAGGRPANEAECALLEAAIGRAAERVRTGQHADPAAEASRVKAEAAEEGAEAAADQPQDAAETAAPEPDSTAPAAEPEQPEAAPAADEPSSPADEPAQAAKPEYELTDQA